MKNFNQVFWRKLTKPFFCLAPMYDVTDEAFRQMVVRHSKELGGEASGWLLEVSPPSLCEVGLRTPLPLVLFTEFVSADGLASEAGRTKLLRELYFTENEHPIVAQIFGAKPENIEKSAKLIKDLGFDGVDINMGCPDKAVEKQGAGASLIKNPKLAQEIILVAKRGAGNMSVSVKTRIGYSKIDIEKWAGVLLEAKPDAITFHLRTRKEMSDVPARWEVLPEIIKIFKNSGIILIANGDIKSVEEGKEKFKKYKGLDGIMIGRGAFGKPWLFARGGETSKRPLEVSPPNLCGVRLRTAVEHAKLFWELYSDTESPALGRPALGRKNFAVMRKHFKAYVAGFPGATALRAELMQADNPEEVEKIVEEFIMKKCPE